MNNEFNELLQRCAAPCQDTKALERLYLAFSPKLLSLAYKVLGDKGLAEEILQEGFIKIWQNAHKYQPSRGSAQAWMVTIVRNKALDKLRALKVRPKEVSVAYEGGDFSANGMNPDNATYLNESLEKITQCMDLLEAQQRECLLLAYYQGYTHQELSNKLSKPLGTVKAWVRRGLEKLRVCLDESL
ncbi:MAG: sigma-70 family RNA polymerase sigma factor [Thiotrichaceae bacterium]|nr:sigma-70 family RNA polymerase sigma factor [Thiotrichaceae bacterium]